MIRPIPHQDFERIVFFTGAGLSVESGMPTYRGAGGIWSEYRYQDYACQSAFDRDPEAVLGFHQLRREAALACEPHQGHWHLAQLQRARDGVAVITQNIDGLLQRAGVAVACELHGSLWRLRCPQHGIREDREQAAYATRRCSDCAATLRPDITWFEDAVNNEVFADAAALVSDADLFVSVGTSGVVWPAAGFARLAKNAGALMVEINPEDTEVSTLFDTTVRASASDALPKLFPV